MRIKIKYCLKEKGMTLLEVMIAVLLVGVALIAIGTLIYQSSVVNKRVEQREIALNVIHQKMEDIRDKGYYEINNETFTVSTLPQANGIIEVVAIDPVNLLKKVTISIVYNRWRSDSTAGDSMVTYVTREGINP